MKQPDQCWMILEYTTMIIGSTHMGQQLFDYLTCGSDLKYFEDQFRSPHMFKQGLNMTLPCNFASAQLKPSNGTWSWSRKVRRTFSFPKKMQDAPKFWEKIQYNTGLITVTVLTMIIVIITTIIITNNTNNNNNKNSNNNDSNSNNHESTTCVSFMPRNWTPNRLELLEVPSQQRSHSAFSKSMCAGVSFAMEPAIIGYTLW